MLRQAYPHPRRLVLDEQAQVEVRQTVVVDVREVGSVVRHPSATASLISAAV
jgi:hypothetical protein